jgi:hypothetical protein
LRRRLRNVVEQVEKLRKREGALKPRASVNDGGSHMHPFEAEHEVARLEIDAGDVLRPVPREVEAIPFGDIHRLGKGWHRPELESSKRADHYR